MVLKLVKCTPPVTLKGGVEGGGRGGLNNRVDWKFRGNLISEGMENRKIMYYSKCYKTNTYEQKQNMKFKPNEI